MKRIDAYIYIHTVYKFFLVKSRYWGTHIYFLHQKCSDFIDFYQVFNLSTHTFWVYLQLSRRSFYEWCRACVVQMPVCERERKREIDGTIGMRENELWKCVCVPERNVLDRCTPQRINRRTWMDTNIKILHGLKVYIYILNERFFSLLKSVPSVSDLCLFCLFISLSSVDMYTTIHDSKHYIYLVIHQFAAVFGQTPITATGDGFVSSFFLFLSLQSPFPSTHTLTHKRTHTHKYMCETWLDLMTRLREKLVGLGLRSPAMRLSTFLAACPRVHRGAKCGFGCRGPACWNVPWIFSAQDWFVLSEISYPFFPTLITVLLSSYSLFLGR